MKKVIYASLALVALPGTANAASLIGNTVNATYLYPDSDSVYSNLGDKIVSDAVEYNFGEGVSSVDFTANQIVITFTSTAFFNSTAFNGYKFTNLTSAFTSANLNASSDAAFSASNITFDNGAILINNTGKSVTSGQKVILDVATAAVPEPATWAMMLLGFGMVAGAARYRRRSANAAFA